MYQFEVKMASDASFRYIALFHLLVTSFAPRLAPSGHGLPSSTAYLCRHLVDARNRRKLRVARATPAFFWPFPGCSHRKEAQSVNEAGRQIKTRAEGGWRTPQRTLKERILRANIKASSTGICRETSQSHIHKANEPPSMLESVLPWLKPAEIPLV